MWSNCTCHCINTLGWLPHYYHYYNRFTTLCPGLPRWVETRRINHTGFCWSKRWRGGSGISWTVCKSFAPRSRQTTMPVPHHSIFLRDECSFCQPTDSVKALKAVLYHLGRLVCDYNKWSQKTIHRYSYGDLSNGTKCATTSLCSMLNCLGH